MFLLIIVGLILENIKSEHSLGVVLLWVGVGTTVAPILIWLLWSLAFVWIFSRWQSNR